MTDETPTGLTMRLIRYEIIEECAKVAETAFPDRHTTPFNIGALIADRIRVLAVQTTPSQGSK